MAATSETNAATSESNAASSATAAGNAQAAAETARDQTLDAFDSFDDRYLGQKASDPTTDNDGNPLVAGALYFNTTNDIFRVYDGSAFVNGVAPVSAFIATLLDDADGEEALTTLVSSSGEETAQQIIGTPVWKDDVAAVLADTKTYTAGTIIRTRKEGFAYECVASSGNLGQTTAGGQELDVLPGWSGYSFAAWGPAGDNSTDDTAKMQSFLSTVRAGAFETSSSKVKAVIPPGYYRITDTLWLGADRASSEVIEIANIEAYGARLRFEVSGAPCLDLTGGAGITIRGLTVEGDDTTTPNVGMLLARSDSVSNSAGNHRFYDLGFTGHFSIACVVDIASEENSWFACVFVNFAGRTTFYKAEENHLGVTSPNTTIPSGAGSNNGARFFNATFNFRKTTSVDTGVDCPLTLIGVDNITVIGGFFNQSIDTLPQIRIFEETGSPQSSYMTFIDCLDHGTSDCFARLGGDIVGLSITKCKIVSNTTASIICDAGANIYDSTIEAATIDASASNVDFYGNNEIKLGGSSSSFDRNFEGRLSIDSTATLTVDAARFRAQLFHPDTGKTVFYGQTQAVGYFAKSLDNDTGNTLVQDQVNITGGNGADSTATLPSLADVEVGTVIEIINAATTKNVTVTVDDTGTEVINTSRAASNTSITLASGEYARLTKLNDTNWWRLFQG